MDLETEISDASTYERTVRRFREAGIVLPTFAQLADPGRSPAATLESLKGLSPDAPDPRNLFRVHWYNRQGSDVPAAVPDHIELPPELTGTDARILVAFGDRFPMIHAH